VLENCHIFKADGKAIATVVTIKTEKPLQSWWLMGNFSSRPAALGRSQ
jgi:hypothetical protein